MADGVSLRWPDPEDPSNNIAEISVKSFFDYLPQAEDFPLPEVKNKVAFMDGLREFVDAVSEGRHPFCFPSQSVPKPDQMDIWFCEDPGAARYPWMQNRKYVLRLVDLSMAAGIPGKSWLMALIYTGDTIENNVEELVLIDESHFIAPTIDSKIHPARTRYLKAFLLMLMDSLDGWDREPEKISDLDVLGMLGIDGDVDMTAINFDPAMFGLESEEVEDLEEKIAEDDGEGFENFEGFSHDDEDDDDGDDDDKDDDDSGFADFGVGDEIEVRIDDDDDDDDDADGTYEEEEAEAIGRLMLDQQAAQAERAYSPRQLTQATQTVQEMPPAPAPQASAQMQESPRIAGARTDAADQRLPQQVVPDGAGWSDTAHLGSMQPMQGKQGQAFQLNRHVHAPSQPRKTTGIHMSNPKTSHVKEPRHWENRDRQRAAERVHEHDYAETPQTEPADDGWMDMDEPEDGLRGEPAAAFPIASDGVSEAGESMDGGAAGDTAPDHGHAEAEPDGRQDGATAGSSDDGDAGEQGTPRYTVRTKRRKIVMEDPDDEDLFADLDSGDAVNYEEVADIADFFDL